LIAGLVNLGVGTLSALRGNVGIAATSLTAGLVLLFAATIDRFELLKGLGIEARTRKLDERIERADEALRRLRELAELTTDTLIDLNNKTGRIAAVPSASESYALAQRTRSILSGLGSKPETVRRILEPWALTMCRDVSYASVRRLEAAIVEQARRLEIDRAALKQPITPNDPAFLQLNAQITGLHEYQQKRLMKFGEIPLTGYPEALLRLFNEAPVTDRAPVEEAKQRASQFAGGMRSIQEAFVVDDREAWFAEIDAVMNP